jgi:4-amino-4-deoxy-L-arabinose transferase-like glycosyltransferase
LNAPRWTWAWAAVAFAARIGYVGLGPGFAVEPYSDSVDYHRLAVHLARGLGFTLGNEGELFPTTFRPPLMPALVAPFYALFGPHYLLALIVQAALGALTVPVAYALANETIGPRAARLTAPLVALWPVLVFFASALGTETLAVLLNAVALLLAVRAFRRGGSVLALGAGLAFGLSALARPTALPLAATAFAWLLAAAPRPFAARAREAFVLALGVTLCVLPWTMRNRAVAGRPVLVTSGGGAALFDSNNPIVVDDPARHGGALSLREVEPWRAQFHGHDEVGIDSLSGAFARAWLAEHRTLWPQLAEWKLARFFRLTGEGGVSGRPAHGGPLRDPVFWSWGLLAAFALVGGVRALARPQEAPFVLALAVVVQALLAVVFWGSLRMRAPVEPELIALGAWTLTDLVARARRNG